MIVYLFILGVIAAILGIVDIVWGMVLKKALAARICTIVLYFLVAIAFIVMSFYPPKPVEKKVAPPTIEEKVAPSAELPTPPVEEAAPPTEETR